ncbi:hypothetical protein N7462_003927 [Penicillium macrosclerotiorum]|uniref:uncharacterized protein n=1 Tax=Penicillium macrosclerotiorum TaxID=303699 RepID=UPI0025466AD2|nr:uncharacterized protein N7462_003927 [Penicillium macrosclerotiorum]KAJ5689535.1 hypothetical protein N7462_003927 [Penicillium macrosclerotiorum]
MTAANPQDDLAKKLRAAATEAITNVTLDKVLATPWEAQRRQLVNEAKFAQEQIKNINWQKNELQNRELAAEKLDALATAQETFVSRSARLPR